MKILFIGFSNVLKKRILPILDRLEFIDSISIAKFGDQSWDDSYKSVSKPIDLFDDYDDAIDNSKASIAYITTTNNSHFIWAKATLNAGMHTIIDKPATISLFETEELLQIARDKQLLLSESTVYTYHPQLKALKDILAQNNSTPRLLTVHFSFPPMDKNNFRYNKELGGGAFLDTSPYAVSIGRFFFDAVPENCYYIENSTLVDGLEISYSILLKYSNGRALIGHFGFNTEYVNRLTILGDRICIDVDKIFTIPDLVTNQIKVRVDNQTYEITTPFGNTFELYLIEIEKCIKSNTFNKFYNDMYMDAYSRELISKNKNKIQHGN
jgi:dTDP-3,4-didehydro-2,6-dideoxy-alpha-D-glucose 3-reductase